MSSSGDPELFSLMSFYRVKVYFKRMSLFLNAISLHEEVVLIIKA